VREEERMCVRVRRVQIQNLVLMRRNQVSVARAGIPRQAPPRMRRGAGQS
jgi:hypothetical protein